MTTRKERRIPTKQSTSGNALNVEQKDGNTLTAKFGIGDKVYLRLNKMNNPSNQMRQYNNTIMYVVGVLNDNWYYVSEMPDNFSRSMPAHVDEMEMRYQHSDNWDEEQWEMYRNSKTTYMKEEKTVKEKMLTSDAPIANRAFGGEFLTQLGYLVNDFGATISSFNDNEDLKSSIKNVDLVISTGSGKPEEDLRVSLDSYILDGKTVYGAIFSKVEK